MITTVIILFLLALLVATDPDSGESDLPAEENFSPTPNQDRT
jgi:hypothetical protein